MLQVTLSWGRSESRPLWGEAANRWASGPSVEFKPGSNVTPGSTQTIETLHEWADADEETARGSEARESEHADELAISPDDASPLGKRHAHRHRLPSRSIHDLFSRSYKVNN